MTTRRAVVEGMPGMLPDLTPLRISHPCLKDSRKNWIDEAYAQLRRRPVVVKGKGEGDKGRGEERFIEGLIRAKESQGLYAMKEGAVETKGGRYEAVMQIPPTASVGMDMVDIYVVKGGEVLEHQRKVLTIENAGIGGWLTEMAEERGLLYGLMAVIVALSAGLAVGVMFKGGGSH